MKLSAQHGAVCNKNPIYCCVFIPCPSIIWFPDFTGPCLNKALSGLFYTGAFISLSFTVLWVGNTEGQTSINHDEERMPKKAVTTSLRQHLASSYLFKLSPAGKEKWGQILKRLPWRLEQWIISFEDFHGFRWRCSYESMLAICASVGQRLEEFTWRLSTGALFCKLWRSARGSGALSGVCITSRSFTHLRSG